MTYSYNRLWKLLIDKRMTKTEMRKQAGISTNILAKMGKGDKVSLDVLERICAYFDCNIGDVISAELRRFGKITQRLFARRMVI